MVFVLLSHNTALEVVLKNTATEFYVAASISFCPNFGALVTWSN